MKNLYDEVKRILEDLPAMRNSDKLLVWEYWHKHGLIEGESISKASYMDAKSYDSISRARRKVQEDWAHLRSSSFIQAGKDRKEATKGNFVLLDDF